MSTRRSPGPGAPGAAYDKAQEPQPVKCWSCGRITEWGRYCEHCGARL
jgi:hypothetical protein